MRNGPFGGCTARAREGRCTAMEPCPACYVRQSLCTVRRNRDGYKGCSSTGSRSFVVDLYEGFVGTSSVVEVDGVGTARGDIVPGVSQEAHFVYACGVSSCRYDLPEFVSTVGAEAGDLEVSDRPSRFAGDVKCFLEHCVRCYGAAGYHV